MSFFVIPQRTFAGDENRACTEFQQVKYPFKWRKYMCVRCGMLRTEHRKSKGKVSDDTAIRDEHLPPCKRLMIRFKQSQSLAAVAAAKEEEEKEKEGEI